MVLSADIFKAYDIRGIVPITLDVETAYLIGRALGALAHEQRIGKIAVGRDGRLSGPDLQSALSKGLQDSGVGVLNIGLVTTPMLYFAAYSYCNGSGIMVTGSHNPAEYNGFKMMLGGVTFSGDMIQHLYTRVAQNKFYFSEVEGLQDYLDISDAYINYITYSVKMKRPLSVAIDCGNGVAGAYAGKLYRDLGCNVVECFCEVDGTFPNHHPDPSKPENLVDLIRVVKENQCDLGLAFDGDGDRLGVVTKDGSIIWPDRQLMLYAQDILLRHPGSPVIFDVKSTGNLAPWIERHGGEPVMCRTGHSFVKARMKEVGALIAGEMSGHIFFKERWFGFDDGLYAGARLLEILSAYEFPSLVLNQLPDSHSTPEITIHLQLDGEGHALVEMLQKEAKFTGAKSIIKIDGLRVEYPRGFGLVRASNTTPSLVFRFEGESDAVLEEIKSNFRRELCQHRVFREMELGF